jgi:hypothetical protein
MTAQQIQTIQKLEDEIRQLKLLLKKERETAQKFFDIAVQISKTHMRDIETRFEDMECETSSSDHDEEMIDLTKF